MYGGSTAKGGRPSVTAAVGSVLTPRAPCPAKVTSFPSPPFLQPQPPLACDCRDRRCFLWSVTGALTEPTWFSRIRILGSCNSSISHPRSGTTQRRAPVQVSALL